MRSGIADDEAISDGAFAGDLTPSQFLDPRLIG
jgi:hypothetical protein